MTDGKRKRRTLRVSNVRQDLAEGLAGRDEELRARACEAIGLGPEGLAGFRITRRSLDARRKRGAMSFVCQVELVVDARLRSKALARALRSGRAVEVEEPAELAPSERGGLSEGAHVVVVGSGPAGVFAALPLALAGVRVTLCERGTALEGRGRKLAAFHRRRELDPDTNLLFGEGGAGTYSDGKLYTRVQDALEVPILEELVACGAPPDILYDARAHIGTDKLHRILPRLRGRLAERGVEFRWETRVEGLVLAPGEPRRVRAVRTSAGEIACDALIVASGHSARDTWAALAADGVPFEAKPFQLGLRIEHPQALVTRGRYGDGPEAEALGAASYNLQCRASDAGPGAFSFCMCPGGKIVASIHEEGLLCTNGMSNSTHSSRWANAAIVTTVRPEDQVEVLLGAPRAELEGLVAGAWRADAGGRSSVERALVADEGSLLADPFVGVAFQRLLERRFFEAGGSDYRAPAQRAPDFVAGRESTGELASSYVFGTCPGRLDRLLPERLRDALRRALGAFGRSLEGFDGPEGLFVGLEARSSGPVRIPRADGIRCTLGFANLYAVGEGAGFAGGIMSAALDGAHAAHELCARGVG